MMKRGKRNNVVRGCFGAQRRRTTFTDPADCLNRLGKQPTGFLSSNDQKSAKRAKANSGTSWVAFAPLWLGAALVGTAYGAGAFDAIGKRGPALAASSTSESEASFELCYTGGGYNCVVDGDTIWLEGQKIRLADIDAPETHEPRCASEKSLGDRTTRRLQQLLNGGAVRLRSIARDEDRYGRKLRIVLVDGTSVGDTLVNEGLARWYAGGRKPWC
jgi:endonuclease YncB( thermonuclease family)